MADAPAGGGSSWGPFEIILAVVLGIGLISTLSGHPLNSDSTNTASTKVKTSNNTSVSVNNVNGCSITLTRPAVHESIATAVTIIGTVGSCNDGTTVQTVYAQVVDSKGTLLSNYTPITVDTTSIPNTFNATVPLTGTALSTTGYLIVAGPSTADGTTQDVRVAIKFATAAKMPTTSTGTTVQTQTTTPVPTTTTGRGNIW